MLGLYAEFLSTAFGFGKQRIAHLDFGTRTLKFPVAFAELGTARLKLGSQMGDLIGERRRLDDSRFQFAAQLVGRQSCARPFSRSRFTATPSLAFSAA